MHLAATRLSTDLEDRCCDDGDAITVSVVGGFDLRGDRNNLRVKSNIGIFQVDCWRCLMALTRRAILKTIAAAPLAAVGTSISPARAEVATFTILVAAIGIFQKLLELQRGPDGTGALLTAINGKLDIAIEQLASIQLALASMSVQIQELKEDVLKAIGQQYAVELFNNTKAALQRITDVQRAADSNGIKLDKHLAPDDKMMVELRGAYQEFDECRRRLREYPQGNGVISAALLEPCVLADHAAFAAGFIDDTLFSIRLEHHLAWIGRISDPKAEYSAAAVLDRAAEQEKALRDNIAAAAKGNDPSSEVANRMLAERSATICVIHKMDVEYWTEWPIRDWRKLKGNEYMIVPTYKGQLIDVHGAQIYVDTKYDAGQYPLELRLGDGVVTISVNRADQVDKSKCKRFENPSGNIEADTMFKLKIQDEAPDSSRFRQGIGGAIMGIFIRSSTYARTLTTNALKTEKDAQAKLDAVNDQILTQRLAQLALLTAAEDRKFTSDIYRELPQIPH
ncbi:hypothetical protein CDO29_29980 (plasmid) [Sinorhizobium meliloti]|nr:hypothetical protein CDO29_29980 [Sinorhizobium meliloti]